MLRLPAEHTTEVESVGVHPIDVTVRPGRPRHLPPVHRARHIRNYDRRRRRHRHGVDPNDRVVHANRVVTGDVHRIDARWSDHFTLGDVDSLLRSRPKAGGVLLLRSQRACYKRKRRGEAQRAGGNVTNAHTLFSSWCVARRDVVSRYRRHVKSILRAVAQQEDRFRFRCCPGDTAVLVNCRPPVDEYRAPRGVEP